MKRKSAKPSPLITVDAAANELGVSTSTVWRKLRTGELPSVRKGGRRWIPRTAVSKTAARTARMKLKPMTLDHPMFKLMGAFKSGGKGPGSRDKHAILDEEP